MLLPDMAFAAEETLASLIALVVSANFLSFVKTLVSKILTMQYRIVSIDTVVSLSQWTVYLNLEKRNRYRNIWQAN